MAPIFFEEREMRVHLKYGVISLTELGYCFFHDGENLLKLPKRTFLEALTSDEKSEDLVRRYPEFFHLGDVEEARTKYERSAVNISC